MNQEYLDPRKIKILGDGGMANVQWMSAVDFRNATDVHIEVESMFPDFRGSKRQFLLDLWDRKIIADPDQMIELLRFGNWDLLNEKRVKAKESVEAAIIQLKKGKEPEIGQFDNAILFVKALTDFIQSPEFSRLIPERKAMVIAHMQKRLQGVQPQSPMGGEATGMMNQNAVMTPGGPQVPAGAPGNSALAPPQPGGF